MSSPPMPLALHSLGRPDAPDFDRPGAARAIKQAIAAGRQADIATWLEHAQSADIADVLGELGRDTLAAAMDLLPLEERAAVLGHLPTGRQAAFVAGLDRRALGQLLHEMSADERADLFNAMAPGEQDRLLPALAQAEREDIRRLSAHPEGTAGAVMTSEYASLSPELDARAAVEELRRVAPDKETIYSAFVVDGERRLLGVVSLRDLIVAPPTAPIATLMDPDVIHARVTDGQESAAEKIARYDLIALPILDADDRLVGILTADDAMDVAEAEATEDFHRAGGAIGTLGASVRDASIRRLYSTRVTWLVLLVFANLFSGAGIAYYEDTIASNMALLFFLPLLIASAGNAGAQASTLMVRAMATGDVEMRDWARMLGREFLVAALLGLTMSAAIVGIGVWRGGVGVAQVVAITMAVVVVIGSLIGMSLPFVLSRLRLDPATASGPLVTSIADIAGVMIFFGIASAMLIQ
ncbi:magnesium transporter [soil metagenome]